MDFHYFYTAKSQWFGNIGNKKNSFLVGHFATKQPTGTVSSAIRV
jgi:hypothetical protein